jgi:hypothetical protein
MQIFSHSLLFEQVYSFGINELNDFVLVDNGYIQAFVFGSTSVHCQTWLIITGLMWTTNTKTFHDLITAVKFVQCS